MRKYKEFIIDAKPFNEDLLTGLLWNLDISGINEDNELLYVFSDIDSTCTKDSMAELLENLVKEKVLNEFSIHYSEKEEINWNEEWEKKLNIIHVSDRFVIRPSTKDYELQNDEIELVIDPKMSFGTGEHETTRLVLKLMEKLIVENKSVLDVGSGTGVLAIAAAKLGAKKVVAFDNDEWCLENGLENISLNNVNNIVDIRLGIIDDIPEENFDIITANINKHILLELGKALFSKLVEKGILILSGLLLSDESDIIAEYTSCGFEYIQTISEGEWISLKFSK